MSFEVIGIVKKILPLAQGSSERGEWKKQEFVIETVSAQYPKQICLNVWGDKVDELSRFNVDDQVKVYFNIESREFKERWYTDLRAWRIEREGERNQSEFSEAGGRAPSSGMNDLPTSLDVDSNDSSDDLPF